MKILGLLKEKKAEASPTGAIVTLIVGISIAVLVLIFVGTLGGGLYNIVEPDINEIGNLSVANETFTATNGTAVGVSHENLHYDSIVIQNITGQPIGLGNFTIDVHAGTFTLNTNIGAYAGLRSNTMNVSYTHGDTAIRTNIMNSITSGFEALETSGDYTPIITLAVVIVLVLSMIFGLGMMTGGRGSNGAL